MSIVFIAAFQYNVHVRRVRNDLSFPSSGSRFSRAKDLSASISQLAMNMRVLQPAF
jgi:hypothetical protein